MMQRLLLIWNHHQNRIMLVFGSILLDSMLILLGNAGVLPLDPINFIFFTFVTFLFALYRPGWMFLILVGVIPLETINLAPLSTISLRPYQWLALVLLVAVLLRAAAHKLPFDLVKPRWFDWVLLLVPVGAFIAAAYAPDMSAALKQALVALSFGVVYAVGRIFWQSYDDVKQSIPFFISSSFVVSAYALWQNLRFLSGGESFAVMAGRPNATFSEADWLGMFIVVVLSILYGLVYQVFLSKEDASISYPLYRISEWVREPKMWFVIATLILSYTILIITVARSAWLGAATSALVFVLFVWFRKSIQKAARATLLIASTAFTALLLVLLFHLTSFDLFNRAQSTASGLQQITVACEQDSALPVLPTKINAISELAAFHCRHIMLEEIENEQSVGYFITTVYRNDPNISIRHEIYEKTIHEIQNHPVTGIGWGSIASVLGTDERGAGLNASNVFLEIWLGSGLIGLIAFAIVWFGAAIQAGVRLFRNRMPDEEPLLLFVLSAWAGITVFNLFNSGILLGFFFLFLSLTAFILQLSPRKTKLS